MRAMPTSIPARLRRGEDVDLVIMVGTALDEQIKAGLILPNSRVDLARSGIAMAVKYGSSKPDITTVEAFKRTLLAAKSIAYSDSASGVYPSTELFPRLGIAGQMKGKTTMIATPTMVAERLAAGDYEIGFQQLGELKPVPGIEIVGPIPADV